MMRATTLRRPPAALGGLLAYYLRRPSADDQACRDGVARGPIDYWFNSAEPPGRWWGQGCAALRLGSKLAPSSSRR